MPLSEKLKIARLTKGWTQEELAEKLGYSTNGYAKLERGENSITLEKLAKLADVLGIEPAQLLDLENNTVFNNTDCHYGGGQGNIVLTEAKCTFELEKAQLLLKERDRENELLRDEISLLKEMLALLKQPKP